MGRGPIFTWRGALMGLVAYLLLGFLFLSLVRAASYFGLMLVAFGCIAYLASTITHYLTSGRKPLLQPQVYIAIPLGAILGITIGAKLGLSSVDVAVIVLQSIFILLSVSLFFLLGINFIKLSKSLVDFGEVSQPIARVRETTKTRLLAKLTKSLNVFKAPKVNDGKDIGKMEQDVACVVSDIRKIHLYNSFHNATILFVLVLMNLSLFKIKIRLWILSDLCALQ